MQNFTLQELGYLSPLVNSAANSTFIKNQLYRNKWHSVKHPEDGRKVLIDYGSIPMAHKIKFGFPLEYREAKQVITEHNQAKETNTYTGSISTSFHLINDLRKELELNFAKFISAYAVTNSNNIKIAEKYSREHALRNACVVFIKNGGYTVREIHQAYLEISQAGTQNNYCKFSNLLKHQWNSYEGVCLTHGSKGKEREDLKKLSNTHILFIEECYKHPNQYSHQLITEMLNRHCEKNGLPTVVRRTVTGYLQQAEVYNRLLIFRNKEAYGKKIKPINRRIGAENAGDLYYMDGSPLQISCLNREGSKEIRPTLFVVLDSYSRKIVGFSITDTEDRYTWLNAMKMAFSMESGLPYECVYDNASATGTTEFKALNDKLLINGCKLRPAKPGEPTAKAQVERWFGTFQNGYQRMIDGFIGEGIRSKRETGRIDAEFLKKVRKQNGVMTFDSLVEMVTYLIGAYNQKGTVKNPNPSKKYADSSKPNMIALRPEQLALLFSNYREITIRNSEVKMTMQHVDYFYSVNDYALNGQRVKVYYEESEMSSVHLFNYQDEYVCELKQKVLFHEAQANQTEKDKRQIMGQSSHNKAFDRKLKNDGKERTKAAQVEFGDDLLKITNPLEMLKDDFNNAETDAYLSYIHDQNNTNPINVDKYSPVNNNEPGIEKRYSNKHTPKKPSLEVIGEV